MWVRREVEPNSLQQAVTGHCVSVDTCRLQWLSTTPVHGTPAATAPPYTLMYSNDASLAVRALIPWPTLPAHPCCGLLTDKPILAFLFHMRRGGAMEGQQDEEYGFVRRDTDVLKRAMEDDGSRSTGSGGRPAEPEAGEPAASGGKGERQRLPTVAPAEPDRAAGKLPGLFKRMSVSGGSSPQSSATKGDELPQSFQVKYLGSQDARGLWGIKHTRRPVDTLVEAAKNMPSGVVLPLVRLTVTRDGVTRGPLSGGQGSSRMYSIDTISYGVQDLVYTRVFSMIIVRESSNKHNDTVTTHCSAGVDPGRLVTHSRRKWLIGLELACQWVGWGGGGETHGLLYTATNLALDPAMAPRIAGELLHLGSRKSPQQHAGTP
ncbi:hypothetical protein PR048_028574 [Dryococelus australis]|uniref:Uncharacterized protein n=1 Tax=Dryococelus australis TaxID=614101 RepID=A0ABQ9GBM5_9NEOP|nr:hypothetical protein PR048_028574 [Dryococelus australis]